MIYHNLKEVYVFPELEKTIQKLLDDGYKFIVGNDYDTSPDKSMEKEITLFFERDSTGVMVVYHLNLRWYYYDMYYTNSFQIPIDDFILKRVKDELRRSTNGKTKEKL